MSSSGTRRRAAAHSRPCCRERTAKSVSPSRCRRVMRSKTSSIRASRFPSTPPPTVLTVTNTTNKITDAKVPAHFPPYVRYVGICSPRTECDPDTQKLTFNQEDGTLTWNMGDIEPGVGLNGTAPRQTAIAIGFMPSTSQIGQEPPLLQNIRLMGIDTLKAAERKKANPAAVIVPELLKSVKDVTTNILGDPGFTSANSTVIK